MNCQPNVKDTQMPTLSSILRKSILRFLIGVTILSCQGTYANAEQRTSESNLHLPRFASLRATRVNLRSGPGVRFPIEWVYLQRGLPVEIIQVYDNWRRVRDWEGTEGWVYHSMLSGRRMARITKDMAKLHNSENPKSQVIAKLEAGVVGSINECPKASNVCEVSFGSVKGWLLRSSFWGAYRGEAVK